MTRTELIYGKQSNLFSINLILAQLVAHIFLESSKLGCDVLSILKCKSSRFIRRSSYRAIKCEHI